MNKYAWLQSMKHTYTFVVALFLTCTTSLAQASTAYNENLTGDWGGKRAALSENGIDIEAVYTQDILSNVNGGVKKGTIGVSSAEANISIDGAKLYNVQGSHIQLDFLATAGNDPFNLTEAWQKSDNLVSDHHTLTLFQAWIEQEFMENKLSLKAGLYDLNSEFYVTNTSQIFLGRTYHIGLEFDETGQNGPSVYPVTAPAIRAKLKPTENTYIQFALLDEIAGVPNHPNGIQFHFNPEDGALKVAEIGYASEDSGHYAIGGWQYSSSFPDFYDVDSEGNPIMRHGNQGFYFIAEKQILPHLNGFARFGASDTDINTGAYAWSAGAVYDAIIPTRKDSQLGLAVSSSRNSPKWNQTQLDEGKVVSWTETIVELTYRDKLTPWLAIQPDIQYIITPNTDPDIGNAWLIGSRFVINF